MFFWIFFVFLFFLSFFGFILHIPMAKAFWGYLIEKVGSTLEVLYTLLHAFYCLVLTLLQNLVYGCALCDCYFSLFFCFVFDVSFLHGFVDIDNSSCTLHGCCYFLMGSGWLLLLRDGLWMVAVISWWALDGCCLFLMGSRCMLLFPDGLWMVAVYSWWAPDDCCLFLVGSGWLLFIPGGLWMVAVYS